MERVGSIKRIEVGKLREKRGKKNARKEQLQIRYPQAGRQAGCDFPCLFIVDWCLW